MKILPFSNIPNYEKFIIGPHKLLMKTISDFLSVSVNLEICVSDTIQKKYGIDITENINRTLYEIQPDKILLITHVIKNDVIYFLGIMLHGKSLLAIRQKRILNYLAGTISTSLAESSVKSFHNSAALLNERLIQRMIASHIGIRGKYNPHLVHFLIDKTKALMSTTFEGRHFSSGLIITKSLPSILDKKDYPGETIQCPKKVSLLEPIDNRYWYMVDGIDSYYLSGMKDFSVQHIYLTLDSRGEMQKMNPFDFLKGADTIFRTYGGKELSILTKDEMEFIFMENVWRFRDYKGIHDLVTHYLNEMSDEVYHSLYSFILYCSKHEISSIIWIPSDESDNALDAMLATSNPLSEESGISICEECHEGLLKRMLSSDGACIISKSGIVLRYGCIIKDKNTDDKGSAAAKAPKNAMKGTGETAAARLAINGIAFKISQDGTIKFFPSPSEQILL